MGIRIPTPHDWREWRRLRAWNLKQRGWANYFRTAVSSRTFLKLDHWMLRRAVRYARRAHPNKSMRWCVNRYWGQLNPKMNDPWVFGDKDSGRYLQKFSWFPIERHVL